MNRILLEGFGSITGGGGVRHISDFIY